MNWRKHNVKETDCNTNDCPPGKFIQIMLKFVIKVFKANGKRFFFNF